MHYLEHTYTKKSLIIFLKFKYNWASYNLSSKSVSQRFMAEKHSLLILNIVNSSSDQDLANSTIFHVRSHERSHNQKPPPLHFLGVEHPAHLV